MPRSVPTMEKRPLSNVMSATAASSASEAACLPFSITVVGGGEDRLALRIEAARAAGAAADRDGIGVALADADLVAVDAEAVGGELDVGGLVALAGGLGADIDIDEPVIGEADFGAFARVAAGRLQIIGRGRARAACPARAASARRAGKPFQSILSAPRRAPARNRRCRRSCRPASSAASPRAGPCCAGAAPTAVDPELARRRVDQPLDQIVALGPSGAAIRIHRHGVGEHADARWRRPTGSRTRWQARRCPRRSGCRARKWRGRRPCWRYCGCAARGTCRPCRSRFRRRVTLSRPCVSHEERLAPFRGPLHRTAELARGVAGQDVLGVEEQLHAEAAADIGRDDAELARYRCRNSGADQVLDQPAALRVGVQRPAPGRGVVFRERGARLHRGDDDAVVDDRVRLIVRAACANSASVAALSPISQSNATLFFTSGQTSGTPGFDRRRRGR